MGNIEFSKEGQAILDNPAMGAYVVKRLSNLNEEEIKAGKIEINLDENGANKLVLQFGPELGVDSLRKKLGQNQTLKL